MENSLKGYLARVVWLLPLSVFVRAIGFPYIELDDPKHIFNNPLINQPSLSSLGTLWHEPFFGLYIPGTYSVWWGLAWIWGTHPAVFHAFNVLLHGINTYLVFRWIHVEFKVKEANARWAALVFAMHPLAVESVVWISGTKDLLMTTAVLLSCLSLRARVFPLLLALLTFFISLLMKPASILLPVLLLWIWGARPASPGMKKGSTFLFLSAALTLCGLFLFVTRASQELEGGSVSLQNLLVALDSLGFYVRKWVWPTALSLDYGRTPHTVLGEGAWAHALWGIGLLLAASAVLVKRHRASAALLLVVIAWLPTSGLLPFAYQKFSTVADRYAYLPLVGGAVLVALLLDQYPRCRSGMIVGVLLLSGLTARQVLLWRGSESLFRASLRANSRSLLLNTNLGYVLLREHRFQEAIPLLERSVAADPSSAGLYVNLATALEGAGKHGEALRTLRYAVSLSPRDPWIRQQLHLSLGLLARPF